VVDGPVCTATGVRRIGLYSGAVTLTVAITRSINVIPVKLSIALGGKTANPAKAGRAKIVEVARRFGIKAPLPDTPSLPIGSDEVSVLEHAVAYATFPNRGKSVTPHAVLEVRTGAGDLVWRFDRDGKKPLQAIPASVAADMAGMMSHVVSEGTARRAALDGIPTAGKTGTTNAYRDAWFVGYTGNFTCAVWYGNDDYSPTNRMTGGSLPAQTWHDIVLAAHRGVEIKKSRASAPARNCYAGCLRGHGGSSASRLPRRRPAADPHQAQCDILVRVKKMSTRPARPREEPRRAIRRARQAGIISAIAFRIVCRGSTS
jgi:penicillin-binding protein 1A